MKTKATVSIIIPVKNEGDHVRSTLDSLFHVRTHRRFEVIVVDDGSTDGCCQFIQTYQYKEKITLLDTGGIGAARARNEGANVAKGDILIFCDAHLRFENDWMDHLVEPLEKDRSDAITPAICDIANKNQIGYGQTLTSALTPIWNREKSAFFETAIIPGGCFAIRRKTFFEVGGFDSRFKTWGYEDVELSIKLWLFGYRCHVLSTVIVEHVFRKKHPYTVSLYDVSYNFLRMAYLHFNEERIKKCKRLCRWKYVTKLERDVINDGCLKERDSYRQKRIYDDDWFFKKFHIHF